MISLVVKGLIAAVVGWTGICIISDKAKILTKQFVNKYIYEFAATPDGIKSIYNEKLDKLKEANIKCKELLAQASGEKKKCERDIMEQTEKHDAFVAQFEDMMRIVENYGDIEYGNHYKLGDDEVCNINIDGCKAAIDFATKNKNKAEAQEELLKKQIVEIEKEYARTKIERDQKVKECELNANTIKINKIMDDLGSVDYARTIDEINKRLEDQAKLAEGSTEVRETSLETRTRNLENKGNFSKERMERTNRMEEAKRKFQEKNNK